MKRVFKTKTFSRWARKSLPDSALCKAAREIELGLFEADLGVVYAKSASLCPGKARVDRRVRW
jgi:hypothetical protein